MFTLTLPKPLAYPISGKAWSLDLFRRFRVWFRQAWCGLHGHDLLLHRTPARLCLRCTNCGHRTPGWQVSARPGFASQIAPNRPRN